MKILITGAEGFVGPHLIDLLILKGINPSDIYGTFFESVGERGQKYNINWFQCDLKNEEIIEKLDEIKPSQIYHLAGQSSVGYSYIAPEETIVNNINSILPILKWMRENRDLKTRTIVVSSADIYKDTGKIPRVENSEMDAWNFYSLSKICVDHFCRLYHQNYGLDIICIRAFNHLGPGQSTRFALPSFARQIAELERLKKDGDILTGNLNVWRDFTDVRDVVRAYYSLMQKGAAGDIYNVCSGKVYNLKDMLDILTGFANVNINIVQSEDKVRRTDIEYIVGDYSKLNSLTEWKPEIDIKTTLKDLLDYFGGKSV
ncbi:GDP-mannose 4,6-dehydratase [candidate division KSB1 bacterium]